jgi:hypothetical protein
MLSVAFFIVILSTTFCIITLSVITHHVGMLSIMMFNFAILSVHMLSVTCLSLA